MSHTLFFHIVFFNLILVNNSCGPLFLHIYQDQACSEKALSPERFCHFIQVFIIQCTYVNTIPGISWFN